MNLSFMDAQWAGRGMPEPYDVILGVEATLRLTSSDDRVAYEEELLPVVELALAIEEWLRFGLHRSEDFSFNSVESDESDLLWCRAEATGWRVGALNEEFSDTTIYDTSQIAAVFSGFVRDVDQWLESTLGRNLASVRLT